MKMKIISIFGTRPEAIKMAPVIKELEKNKRITSIVVSTGQHSEMLKQVIDIFSLKIDYDLNIMKRKQSIKSIITTILTNIEEIYIKEKPDIVLVHGDTSTSFAAGLSAFLLKIPVAHVEAGLRTYNMYSPFPEEMNRNLLSKISSIHFCPTVSNANNLKKENITKNVFVTGNSVIDTFKYTIKSNYQFQNEQLRAINLKSKRVILVTAHRRENIGQPLIDIFTAIEILHNTRDDIIFIFPVHLNPLVRECAYSILGALERVYLIEPLQLEDMHNLMSNSYLILSDSGGIQEEAPFLKKPVLVLREETERIEVLDANLIKLVGSNQDLVINTVNQLLDDLQYYKDMQYDGVSYPYGNGNASELIVEKVLNIYDK